MDLLNRSRADMSCCWPHREEWTDPATSTVYPAWVDPENDHRSRYISLANFIVARAGIALDHAEDADNIAAIRTAAQRLIDLWT